MIAKKRKASQHATPLRQSKRRRPHPQLEQRPAFQLKMLKSVYDQIREAIGRKPAEHGGMLGGKREAGLVTHFYFDRSAKRSRGIYTPDHALLNELVRQWNEAGIDLLGFVHSHPGDFMRPSHGDKVYAAAFFEANPHWDWFFMPIVQTLPDTGAFGLHPYAALPGGKPVRVGRVALKVVEDRGLGRFVDHPPDLSTDEAKTPDLSGEKLPVDTAETFRRVTGAYDLDRMRRCRGVFVGTGGAASFIEELARAGLGEFVLIDPDIVSETNLATQQVYRRDIGRAKVECLAERILDINPEAVVFPIRKRIEEIDDATFEQFIKAPATSLGRPDPPRETLLCGLTDNFDAQDRVNKLALQFGVPSLCAQVYFEGRGAEITFTYPGITPACHRCVLRSRYQAYLDEGFENDVTSDGTPIFATTRLNALKGMLALAILHHGTDHPRWGGLLNRIGKRNLIQIRMDPDIASSLGLSVFDRVFGGGDRERMLFDEPVWLPQDPEPDCPDCGGTGRLDDARGSIRDTRIKTWEDRYASVS